MPQANLGSKNEPALELNKSSELVAVRTRSRRSLRRPVQPLAAAEVADGQLVVSFPEAGVEVYRVPPATKSLDARKSALRRDPDVEFAGGVLVDAAGEPVLYTENLFIKFVDEAEPESCRKVIRDANLTIKRELNYAANAFFAAASDGTGEKIFDIAQSLLARPDVEYCHPELVRRRARRRIYDHQWHLQRTSVAG